MATSKMLGKNKEEKKTTQQTWNEITGIMRIYGHTFEGKSNGKKYSFIKWSTSVSAKHDDEYTNVYVDLKFRGNDSAEPETVGVHTIDISNAFFSVDAYTTERGPVEKLVLIVTANDVIE